MNIGSLCARRIVSIDSAGTLVEAAGLMREHHVGALVVTTPAPEGLRVIGIVTDRDLVIDVLARGLNPAGTQIGELASKQIVSVPEEGDIASAIDAMQRSGVRRVLVADAEQALMGIVSFDDLMDACANEMAGLAKVIRSGIEREVAQTAATPRSAPVVLRVPAMGTVGWGNALA
jgi:CBS domain-containing protein